ncbi:MULTISPECIES: hypothetical protein [Chryseobacterium]|uniref:Toxin-antitoxin system YwqK family antitoxin n=1 Tax=Candidatus Chryseobacterium massiliense TaxID=204089 RepID=A0A3D9AX68_9FLAO|nr:MULTISPECIES: hypothetical protein [Chryseobacterium]REC45537.1 hypothetical protein DRF68_15535 [Candidatus Chryseobacterium massiliae]HAO08151.1 hypothetical protein [Chryseobacterium sp.]
MLDLFNKKLRLEDIDDRFYTKNDINGNAVYFLDKEFKEPFTGEIFVTFNGVLESEAQYKNGYKNGIENIYNSNGILEQTNENRGNVIFGVSKEFNEEGDVVISSIVYNNDYIRSVENSDGEVVETQSYTGKYGENLPEYLQNLLRLSKEDLFNYEFKSENPYLNIN